MTAFQQRLAHEFVASYYTALSAERDLLPFYAADASVSHGAEAAQSLRARGSAPGAVAALLARPAFAGARVHVAELALAPARAQWLVTVIGEMRHGASPPRKFVHAMTLAPRGNTLEIAGDVFRTLAEAPVDPEAAGAANDPKQNAAKFASKEAKAEAKKDSRGGSKENSQGPVEGTAQPGALGATRGDARDAKTEPKAEPRVDPKAESKATRGDPERAADKATLKAPRPKESKDSSLEPKEASRSKSASRDASREASKEASKDASLEPAAKGREPKPALGKDTPDLAPRRAHSRGPSASPGAEERALSDSTGSRSSEEFVDAPTIESDGEKDKKKDLARWAQAPSFTPSMYTGVPYQVPLPHMGPGVPQMPMGMHAQMPMPMGPPVAVPGGRVPGPPYGPNPYAYMQAPPRVPHVNKTSPESAYVVLSSPEVTDVQVWTALSRHGRIVDLQVDAPNKRAFLQMDTLESVQRLLAESRIRIPGTPFYIEVRPRTRSRKY